MVIRELTGGLYFGEPRGIEGSGDAERRGFNTMAYTAREIERMRGPAFGVARGAAAAPHVGGQGQRARRVPALARGGDGRGPQAIPTSSSTTSSWTTAPWRWWPIRGASTPSSPRTRSGTSSRTRPPSSRARWACCRRRASARSAATARWGCTSRSMAPRRTSPGRGSRTRWRPSCRPRCCSATRWTGRPTRTAWSRPSSGRWPRGIAPRTFTRPAPRWSGRPRWRPGGTGAGSALPLRRRAEARDGGRRRAAWRGIGSRWWGQRAQRGR